MTIVDFNIINSLEESFFYQKDKENFSLSGAIEAIFEDASIREYQAGFSKSQKVYFFKVISIYKYEQGGYVIAPQYLTYNPETQIVKEERNKRFKSLLKHYEEQFAMKHYKGLEKTINLHVLPNQQMVEFVFKEKSAKNALPIVFKVINQYRAAYLEKERSEEYQPQIKRKP